ncbi:MAG: DUF3987 domain-containing protein [Mariprofundaceae bacterium]|nr:DUF3987 domain-containing protein [Mariprofundaceae bacterium]
MHSPIEAKEIAARLASRADAVAAYLLPSGRLDGNEWRSGDVSGSPGQSLGIHLAGDKAGVWQDFATGEGGDLLSLWQAVRGVDFKQALNEAAEYLGMDTNPDRPKPAKPLPVRTSPPEGVDGVSRFTYTDADKRPVIYVTRQDTQDGKRIRQWGHGPDGKGWMQSLKHAPKPRPLYRLPAILQADGVVCIHEGEKAVVAACKASLYGIQTTTIGGAGNAKHSDFTPLKGRDVCIIPDHDEPGENHAQQVAKLATDAGAKSVRIVHLPDLPPKGDVVEWLAAGGTDKQWRKLIAETKIYTFHPSDKSDKSDKTPWPEPIPLAQVDIPKPLNLRLMPDCLAEVVGNVAEAIQAPHELAWGVAMAVLATAIGRRAKVELPTHKEPSPLWPCCILPPGSRKSGVFQTLTKPLADIEAKQQETWHEGWLCWKAEAELAEANIQAIKQGAKKKDADRKALAKKLREEKRTLEAEPVKPCLYVTDTTTEALRKALQEQGSIGLLSAEGSSLLEAFGRYNGGNKGTDMALFLAAHAGDADKGARVSGTHGVREALASMGITAQPDVLQSIGRDRMARGRGLIDRFLFLIPQDPRGNRTYRNQPKLSPAIENKWAKIIRRIMDIEPQETIPCVGVDEQAADAWLDFAQDIEDRQKPGGDLRGMAGFASKLAGAVGRIALAYSFAQGRDASSRIDAATMLQSIGTGLAMIDHARAAMQMMGEDEATARASLVLDCLARNKVKAVKPRDIARNHWGGCKDVEEARATLLILCKHDYCRAVTAERQSDTGAMPKDAYEVNPCVMSLMSLLSPHVEPEKVRRVI